MKVDRKEYQRGLQDGLAGRVPDLPIGNRPTEKSLAYAKGWKVGARQRRRLSSNGQPPTRSDSA